MTNLEYQDGGQSVFQYINKLPYIKENLRKVKTLFKNLFLPPQRTLDLGYQDGGDELQNLITEITAMHYPGLFTVYQCFIPCISVVRSACAHARLF